MKINNVDIVQKKKKKKKKGRPCLQCSRCRIVETWCRRRRRRGRAGWILPLCFFLCVSARRPIVYCVVTQLQQKQWEAASIDPALQTRQKTGPMNSKSCFFLYQTCMSCVLFETLPRPRKQTAPNTQSLTISRIVSQYGIGASKKMYFYEC